MRLVDGRNVRLIGLNTPELSRQASESLAGRVEIIEMGGFGVSELRTEDLQALWLRGGFPRSFLAKTERDTLDWRKNFTSFPSLPEHLRMALPFR